MPASFSKATTILRTSFLNPFNSPKPSSFRKTSAFHSASICCFAFLAFDLLVVSTLAFARALSTSKGLQVALALAQGAQEVALLKEKVQLKKSNDLGKLLTAKFEGCKVSRSPHISRTDSPHQRRTFPSPLPTPRAVHEPPEFLLGGNGLVAS